MIAHRIEIELPEEPLFSLKETPEHCAQEMKMFATVELFEVRLRTHLSRKIARSVCCGTRSCRLCHPSRGQRHRRYSSPADGGRQSREHGTEIA